MEMKVPLNVEFVGSARLGFAVYGVETAPYSPSQSKRASHVRVRGPSPGEGRR